MEHVQRVGQCSMLLTALEFANWRLNDLKYNSTLVNSEQCTTQMHELSEHVFLPLCMKEWNIKID